MSLYFCQRCNAFCEEQNWNQKYGTCKAHTPRKYRNHPTVVDGIRFDSAKEAVHYRELVSRQRTGEISNLVLQPKFKLIVNNELIATYAADFQYIETATGTTRVIDIKSAITRKERSYRLIRKLMHALYGITIIEV
jgi:hypothetical protein